MYLEEKYDIPVEKIPELITQAKGRIDRLEDQTQEILRKKQQAQEECDAIRQEHDIIVAELEKYRKEIPLIERIKQLEAESDEAKKLNEHYETYIMGLKKELNDARREAARFDADGIEIDARWKDTASRLSLCRAERDKLKVVNEKLTAENRKLKIDISNIKGVDKQLAENDGQTDDGNRMRNP